MNDKVKEAEQIITKYCGPSALTVIDREVERFKAEKMPRKSPGEDEVEYAVRVIKSGGFLGLIWDIQKSLSSHLFKTYFGNISSYFK